MGEGETEGESGGGGGGGGVESVCSWPLVRQDGGAAAVVAVECCWYVWLCCAPPLARPPACVPSGMLLVLCRVSFLCCRDVDTCAGDLVYPGDLTRVTCK